MAIIASVSHSVIRCSRFSGVGGVAAKTEAFMALPCPVRKTSTEITSNGITSVLTKMPAVLMKASFSVMPALTIRPRKMMPLWLDTKLAPLRAP